MPLAPKAPRGLRHLPLASDVRETDRRWRPIYAVWETTLKCDLACRHCGSRAGRERPDELDTAECLDLVRPCPGCGRHIRASEAACPFCACVRAPPGAGQGLTAGKTDKTGKATRPLGRMSRAALWAAGATLIGGAACEKTVATPVYGAPATDAASLEAGATPDGRAADASGDATADTSVDATADATTDTSADVPAAEVSPGTDAGIDAGRDVRDSGFSNDRGVVALYGAVAAPNT